jgi:hypothetical protein
MATSKSATSNQRLAWRALNAALDSGEIARQPCLHAGPRCSPGTVEAHHYRGYAPEHWLDVIWLCKQHHLSLHAVLRMHSKLSGPVAPTMQDRAHKPCRAEAEQRQ